MNQGLRPLFYWRLQFPLRNANTNKSAGHRSGDAIFSQLNHDFDHLLGGDGLGSAHDSSNHHLASFIDASAERQTPSLHRSHLQINRSTTQRFTHNCKEVGYRLRRGQLVNRDLLFHHCRY